ncbi:Tad domain-containing protein [Qipengyuania sp. 6B39]|uniref:TadE/TadG family type IV pilus assembly protein n=1 Tax=Qipengyuania proteolytica TaxID=2867239 RepID=UPI001C898D46|nr:TadE/TadG family type IV pilus assembly protein [Qipengyuania proteolytica]MBX7494343.1 Tad domain-containing protein [Qipengyuania proteolytica]
MGQSFLSRLYRDETGNVLPLFAAGILPLIALVGGAMDISVAYMARSKLQKACDSAALAGRQAMDGTSFKEAHKKEAEKFFDFNYPAGLYRAASLKFNIKQNGADNTELLADASAKIPTSLMRIFGFTEIPVAVTCNAKKDIGHNDIVMVLDVTGSMNDSPSTGGGSKIAALRDGASGLYRALENAAGSTTRYGIVPYSHTVNVGRSLQNRDIVVNQQYVDGNWYKANNGYWYFNHTGLRTVHISNSTWNGSNTANGNRQGFRTSGDACIEERASIGYSSNPIQYANSVSLADVNTMAANGNDSALQFGRYDPGVQRGQSQNGCPSEATTLREYASETSFNNAVTAATARVTGGTYHDIGMLWGLRYISRNGFFAADNPDDLAGIPVNQHIVFMTDGKLDTGGTLYSAFGVDSYTNRMQGTGSRTDKHISRFKSICNLAKSMKVTVWVIALDVTDTSEIKQCATSETHFKTSDGSDLEQVFADIGRGIGNLRLTQ